MESVVKSQVPNSAVSVPSSLKYDYYYTYATEGTIGTEDCTIKVIRTLKNTNIVNPLTGLSNSKSYYIRTRENNRNELSTYTDGETTYLAGVVKNSLNVSAKKFAIINYENNYYLYSVTDAKFVVQGSENTKAPLAATVTGTSDRIAFSPTTAPLYQIRFDGSASKIFNVSNSSAYPYGIVFNAWGASSNQWDDGCQYTIEEADDFDATDALAALEEFFYPTNYWSRVEEEVVPFLDEATIGKLFGLSTTAAAEIASTYGTPLTNEQFNEEEYNGIVAIKNAGILYPEEGKFYVIKSVSNGKYINVKSANGIYADADAPVAGSIVKAVVRNNHMYFATQGKEFGWCYNSDNKALLDANDGGKYVHWSDITTPGQIAFAHCIGNGEGTYASYLPGSYYTVGENNQICGGGATAAAAQWTFEEATTIAIALNGPVDGSYYATLCVPFDITLEGATAYTLTKEGATLNLSEGTTSVAAGTPVLLVGTGASATATIGTNYSATISTTTALTGSYLEIASFNGTTNYVLGSDGTKVGFYHWDGPTLKANRAYIAGSGSGSGDVKGFVLNFDDDATGIKAIDNGQQTTDNVIYNVAGQRLQKMQKGINIVNGKKILK